jgi:outer membrane protein assembly factor BamB
MRIGLMISVWLVLGVNFLSAENWPGWRGPRGDGTSQETKVPTTWNGKTGENIAWKVNIPGVGHSSPVVWEDKIFLATCLPESEERVLLCLDRKTGETLWRKTVVKSQLETKHNLNSHASSTPATDGKIVVVAFLKIDGSTVPAPNVGAPRPITPGDIIVAAYDLEGHKKWESNVGRFISAHGFCTNPVLFEDLVIINGDHDGQSYLFALDRETGKIRWKDKRDHGIRSYSTPLIRNLDGRLQMVLSGSESVISYDPHTGKRFWTMDGPTEQFVASMVDDGHRFFVTAGFPDHHILAINPDGTGNVTETHIVWRTTRGASYVPSPVVSGKYLIVVADNGIASCFDSASGERYWMNRVGPRFSASLVAADGLVYITSDPGVTTVIKPGPEMEKIAENELGEIVSTSPAISQGQIFLRGQDHLFCIGKE